MAKHYEFIYSIPGNNFAALWFISVWTCVCKQRSQCRLYPFSPQPLSVISLLFTNTVVSPVRACLSIWLERFRGSQKEDERRPHNIQSSLCVNISYPTQLREVGGGYVDNKMVSFHTLNKDWTKEISFFNFSTQFLPRPWNWYQCHRNWSLHFVYHPKK